MTARPTIVASILGVTLLGGCSLHYWSKPGATAQDERNDYAVCAADARITGPLVRPARLASCMRAHGYHIDDTGCRGEIAGIPVQCARQ